MRLRSRRGVVAGIAAAIALVWAIGSAGHATAAEKKDFKIVWSMKDSGTFSFNHGLLGEGAKTVDKVGILFPGGETLGDGKNVKMRFSADYMKMAADHKL